MKNVKLLPLILIVVMALCFTGCKKENPWAPSIQGSNVLEMPYEEISGEYSVEKYTDFKSFKKSELADYEFVGERAPAKGGRYSEEYFKTRDLAVIKFNKPEKGIEYTVINADVSGNDCCVSLLPVKDTTRIETQNTTYYCFLETEKDISDWDLRLEFEDEVVNENRQLFIYSDKHNMSVLLDDKAPVLFSISSYSGIAEFIDNDEILEKDGGASTIMRLAYTDEILSEKDLLLVRVPSGDLEDCAVYFNNNTIEIVCVKSNHYKYSWNNANKHSKLLPVLVPKGFNPDSVVRTNYTEYEDNADNKPVRTEYTFDKATAITDNLTRYDFK